MAAAGLQLKKFLPALQIAPPGFLCHASGDKVRRDRFTNTLLAVVGRKTVARARFFSSPLAAHRDLGDGFVPMWSTVQASCRNSVPEITLQDTSALLYLVAGMHVPSGLAMTPRY